MPLPPHLIGALLGLAAAAAWGASDFSGGFASKHNNSIVVLGLGASAGLVVFVGFALFSGEAPLPWQDVLWAAGAGVMGGLGLVFLYRGLAGGNAALVSPTAGVIGAALPVVVGALLEGLPAPMQLAGFILGLGGIWLAARAPENEPGDRRKGLGLALIAGLGFGGFFVLLAQVGSGQVFTPLAITKVVQIGMVAAIMAGSRLRLATRQGVPIALLGGLLDAGGNAFYLAAANITRMDVAAVLASMYPAGTVLLARLVNKEKVSPAQWLGVALCLGAVALIAYG
jgi:drug/metabolite transporter (DMT)-like permease